MKNLLRIGVSLGTSLARRFGPPCPAAIPLGLPTVRDLSPYLILSLKHRYVVRPPDDYLPSTTDVRQQIIDLVDHLYVRYPVPLFLYRPMLSDEGLRLVFGSASGSGNPYRLRTEAVHRSWFRAVAAGDSLAALVKGTMSKREAHWFLQAPDHNTIEHNVCWAKLAALGVPAEGCDFVLNHFGPFLDSERLPELGRFYARVWDDIEVHERREIADFLRSSFYGAGIDLTGRTAASVQRLSQAWHQRFAQAYDYDDEDEDWSNYTWEAMFSSWETKIYAGAVRAVELTSSQELRDEGSHQRHCVSTYAERCDDDKSRIVSLRWFRTGYAEDLVRITIEVDVATRNVVQIRGRDNRMAYAEEWTVIGAWAKAQGLTCIPYA